MSLIAETTELLFVVVNFNTRVVGSSGSKPPVLIWIGNIPNVVPAGIVKELPLNENSLPSVAVDVGSTS